MSKIAEVHGSDDYKLLIDFEDGSKIVYNMQGMVNTLPYRELKNLSRFQEVKIDGKFIYWASKNGKESCFPLKISIDNILLALRE